MPKIKKKCPKKGKVVEPDDLGGEAGSGKGDIEKEIKGIGGLDETGGLGEGLSTKKCHCTGKCSADSKCKICGRVSMC